MLCELSLRVLSRAIEFVDSGVDVRGWESKVPKQGVSDLDLDLRCRCKPMNVFGDLQRQSRWLADGKVVSLVAPKPTGSITEQARMPRLPRLHVPGGCYHVVLRGNHREDIFSRDEYPWSSHRAYLGDEHLPWLTTDYGLGLLGTTVEGARDAYRQMIDGTVRESDERPSVLLPSADPRVIGADRFLASLPPPRLKPRSLLTLEELTRQVCEAYDVRVERVLSPSREPKHQPLVAKLRGLRLMGGLHRCIKLHAILGEVLPRYAGCCNGGPIRKWVYTGTEVPKGDAGICVNNPRPHGPEWEVESARQIDP